MKNSKNWTTYLNEKLVEINKGNKVDLSELENTWTEEANRLFSSFNNSNDLIQDSEDKLYFSMKFSNKFMV